MKAWVETHFTEMLVGVALAWLARGMFLLWGAVCSCCGGSDDRQGVEDNDGEDQAACLPVAPTASQQGIRRLHLPHNLPRRGEAMIEAPWGYNDHGRCMHCSALPPGDREHADGCRTALLESTIEAMGKALEHARWRNHKFMPEACDGCTDLDAALASWRGLTRKEGERG